MQEIDDELIARAIRWCASAGRHASADDLRAALSPLSWDQLLIARALLADPPPARPLGPWALADLARGALPDVAAERERAGQYGPDAADSGSTPGAAGRAGGLPRAPAHRLRTARRVRRAAGPVIRRARDRAEAPPAAPPPPLPLLDTLFEAEGRAVLERLVRVHGARRGPLVAALAQGWRRGDGAAPGLTDLKDLFDAHGLARSFERRERDDLLHALRAAGGVLSAAAARVGSTTEELAAALARCHATEEAETIRSAHRRELARRATLSERARLLLSDADRLRDLGMLEEIAEDLRQRIPEHVRALRSSGESPLAAALIRTLAIAPRDLPRLAAMLGLDIEPAAGSGPRPRARPASAPPRPRTGPRTPRPTPRDGRRRPRKP